MKGEGNDFTPAELVINVEVVDANDAHTVLTDFDPPLEIEFKFPAFPDQKRQGTGRPAEDEHRLCADDLASMIKVGFWNGAALGSVYQGKTQLSGSRATTQPATSARST